MQKVVAIALVLAGGAALALAQTTPTPATGSPAAAPAAAAAHSPATTQASPAQYRETPRRALLTYSIEMAAGNEDLVRASFTSDTDPDRAVGDAYARLTRAIHQLRAAATDKYGPDGFDNIGFGKMFADEIKQLQQTRFALEPSGDVALAYTNADNKPDLVLVKTSRGWRISPTKSFRQPERRAARINAQAQAYEQLATEIAAGKYRLATDARVAGTNKVREAMHKVDEEVKKHDASPGAATRPTDGMEKD